MWAATLACEKEKKKTSRESEENKTDKEKEV